MAEHINADELLTTFNDSKKFMLPLHDPFDEFERIARNKPHPGIDKSLPRVTDGTLAAIIQEQPKRVIQQIPTGLVKADNEWLELVAGSIYIREILPNANYQVALIQKAWALVSKCLTYGSQPTYVQFLNRGDYFGTDFSLPYIKDVLLEPGKLSDRDSDVIFVRTWWSKSQIKGIIEKTSMLSKKAKDRGDKSYEAGWDVAMLSSLLDAGSSEKEATSQTPAERNKQNNNGFYEIVHAFQRGIGATFYSFSPKLPDGKNVLRRKKSKDPRGYIPIHFMYANIDLSNPLGRGSVEMSGGMQNLLDSETQSYQFMRNLMLNPPIEKHGTFSKNTLKYAPGAIWDMGADPTNMAMPVKLETASLNQFPINYGLIKSQILQLNSGGGDTTISASVGDPSSSKTPQGVKNSEAKLGISDNHVRKQFESVWEEISETMINLWFAERSGKQELTLDEETAAKLEKLQPGAVRDNKIRIDYDTETPKLKFQVDGSSSNIKDNAEQLEHAIQALELVGKYPQFDRKQGGNVDTTELFDRIISSIGLEDPEKIIVKPEVDPQTGQPVDQQQQQPQMTPDQVMQIVQQAMKEEKAKSPDTHPVVKLMETLSIKFVDLDPTAQAQVLQQIGLQSDGNTPTAQNMAIQASDHQMKLAQAASSMQQADQSHALSSIDTATRAAQLMHTKQTAQQSHDLAAKSQADSTKLAAVAAKKKVIPHGR